MKISLLLGFRARKFGEETGLSPIITERKGVMTRLWPKAHYITTFFRADVKDDVVKMNDEHRDYKWVSRMTDDLHPYLKQMIEEADIFT